MKDYSFAVIVAAPPQSHEEILDAADALGKANCMDASIRGHSDGMELLFDRSGKSLQSAMASAIADIESAGYSVLRVEVAREAIQV